MVQVHEEPAPPSGPLHHMLDQLRAASEDRLHERHLVTLLEALVDAVEPQPSGRLCPTCASWARDPVTEPGLPLERPHHPACPHESPFERMAARARELLDAAGFHEGDLVRYHPMTGRITQVSTHGDVRDLGITTRSEPIGVLFATAPELARAVLVLEAAWRRERASREASEQGADTEIRALKEALGRTQGDLRSLTIRAHEQHADALRVAAERDTATQFAERLRQVCDHHLQALGVAVEVLDTQNLNLPPRAREHLVKARALLNVVFPHAATSEPA